MGGCCEHDFPPTLLQPVRVLCSSRCIALIWFLVFLLAENLRVSQPQTAKHVKRLMAGYVRLIFFWEGGVCFYQLKI